MIRSITAACISTILVLGSGEIFARWWISSHGNALDMTRHILLIDSHIGWRQRSNLDTTFLDIPLSTNEIGLRDSAMQELRNDSDEKILIVGPSSAFGWGVASEDTYASKLEGMLLDKQVINAGQIGHSSHQGVLSIDNLLRELHPAIVVIAYGVNDLDRNRFYFQSALTDREEFANSHSEYSVRIQNLIFSSALTSLMYKASQSLGMSEGASHQDVVRVPKEDFETNMRTIIEKVREAGAKSVLMTTTVHMPEYFEGSNEPERIAQGVREYNAIIRSIGEETGTPVADIDAVFARIDTREDLFVDPVHFSPEGNRVVAEELFTIISSTYLP